MKRTNKKVILNVIAVFLVLIFLVSAAFFGIELWEKNHSEFEIMAKSAGENPCIVVKYQEEDYSVEFKIMDFQVPDCVISALQDYVTHGAF